MDTVCELWSFFNKKFFNFAPHKKSNSQVEETGDWCRWAEGAGLKILTGSWLYPPETWFQKFLKLKLCNATNPTGKEENVLTMSPQTDESSQMLQADWLVCYLVSRCVVRLPDRVQPVQKAATYTGVHVASYSDITGPFNQSPASVPQPWAVIGRSGLEECSNWSMGI